ncbi:MAG: hypothetical protein WCO58_00835 [bacterium]
MCKKTNQNRKGDHQPAKQVVPELLNEVLAFNSKGRQNKVENYVPLAQKLHKHGYSVNTFLKYWDGDKLTERMISNLQNALDIVQGRQEQENTQLITEEENSFAVITL